MAQDVPPLLKIITVWLLLGTAVFLALQAWMAPAAPRGRLAPGAELVLVRAPDGHYHWPGTVNGRPVDFLVDTGATRSALPGPLARQLGLPEGAPTGAQTAGGTVQGWTSRATLDLEGGLRLEAWPVTVLPALGSPLLGMDVLGRLDWSQNGHTLRLRPRP